MYAATCKVAGCDLVQALPGNHSKLCSVVVVLQMRLACTAYAQEPYLGQHLLGWGANEPQHC